MKHDLADAILNNSFVSRLLEHQIDKESYHTLCHKLQQLAEVWGGRPLIEKALARELYVIASVMRNEVLFFRENGQDDKANELADMFIEIDRLITEECFT